MQKNTPQQSSKSPIILPLMPFLVIFFLSPSFIPLPLYIGVEINLVLGILSVLFMLIGGLILYLISILINKIITKKLPHSADPLQFSVHLLLFAFIIASILLFTPDSMTIFALLLSGPPALITASYSYQYLKKRLYRKPLSPKLILHWFCFTIILGATSSFLISLIPILLIARQGQGFLPALITGLIGAICALLSCMLLFLYIKTDQHIKRYRIIALTTDQKR